MTTHMVDKIASKCLILQEVQADFLGIHSDLAVFLHNTHGGVADGHNYRGQL